MGKNNHVFGEYFFGKRISEYGLQHGCVDYGTLASAFDAVLNNSIMQHEVDYWECLTSDCSYEYDGETYTDSELNDLLDNYKEQLDGLDDDSKEYAELETKIEEIENALDDPCYPDVYQTYIISEQGAEILQEYTNEIVYYNAELDMYTWCVTHYGTAWDYVLTDIPCKRDTE